MGNGRYYLREMISKDVLKSVQNSICKEHHVGMVIYDHTLNPLTPVPAKFPGIEQLDIKDKQKLSAFYKIIRNQHSFVEGKADFLSFVNGLFIQITAPIYFKNQLVGAAIILQINRKLDSEKNKALFTYLTAAEKSREGLAALQDHELPKESFDTRYLLDEFYKVITLLMDGGYQKLKLAQPAEEVQLNFDPEDEKFILFTENQGFIIEAIQTAAQALHYNSKDALVGKNFFQDIIADSNEANNVQKQLATVDSMLKMTLGLHTRLKHKIAFDVEFRIQKNAHTVIGYEISMAPKRHSESKTEKEQDQQAIHLIEESFQHEVESQVEDILIEEEPEIKPAHKSTQDIPSEAFTSLSQEINPISFSFKGLEQLLDAVPLPFFVLNQHKNICWWNKAIENLLSIPGITAIEHKFENWIHRDMQQVWTDKLAEIQNSSQLILAPFPLTVYDQNKNVKYLQITLSRVQIFGSPYISVLLEPVSGQTDGSAFPDLGLDQNLFKKIRKTFEFNDDHITRILSMSQPDAAKQLKTLADKNQDINRQLCFFTGEIQPQIKTIDLNRVVNKLTHRLQTILAKSIRVDCRLDTSLHKVPADPDLITFALSCLCKNAIEAMPQGGRLSLRTFKQKSEHELEYVCITVQDSGSGIHPDITQHLYMPFTSTKPDTGKGLGLASVFGIIQNHGGKINFQTNANGTRFQIYLPCGNENMQRKKSRKDFKASIMVIDDEEAVAEATASTLELRGYFSIMNTDAQAAIEMLRAHPNDFDILIVDYHLKSMTGITFAEEVKTFLSVPIIFYSGEKDFQLEKYIRDTGNYFMTKPFKTSDLTELIDRVIEKHK